MAAEIKQRFKEGDTLTIKPLSQCYGNSYHYGGSYRYGDSYHYGGCEEMGGQKVKVLRFDVLHGSPYNCWDVAVIIDNRFGYFLESEFVEFDSPELITIRPKKLVKINQNNSTLVI